MRFCGHFLNILMSFNFRSETCFEEGIKLSTKSMSWSAFLNARKYSTKGRKNAYFFDLHFWNFVIFWKSKNFKNIHFGRLFPWKCHFPLKTQRIVENFRKKFKNFSGTFLSRKSENVHLIRNAFFAFLWPFFEHLNDV